MSFILAYGSVRLPIQTLSFSDTYEAASELYDTHLMRSAIEEIDLSELRKATEAVAPTDKKRKQSKPKRFDSGDEADDDSDPDCKSLTKADSDCKSLIKL